MTIYIIRRIISMIPVLFGVATITFILFFIAPGDPARILMGQRGDPETIAAIRAEWGLDDPIYIQYFRFMWRIIRLDFPRSFKTRREVLPAIWERLPATAELAIASMVIAVILGISAGIISAIKQYSIFDYSSMIGALLGVSAPIFWVGLLLIYIFGYKLRIVPTGGFGRGDIATNLHHLILPAITLGLRPVATIARLTRSSMLEVIRQDYIKTAYSKGLKGRVVIFKHALRNALIPVVTYIGLMLAALLGGAIITESVFSWPGIGKLAIDAVNSRDLPQLEAVTIFFASLYVFANLIVDISYGFLDPRIRYD